MASSVTGGITIDEIMGGLPAASVTNATVASGADIDTAKIAQRQLAKFFLDFANWRVHDAFSTLLPSTGSNDDLGLVANSYGLKCPYIVFTTITNTTATRYARFVVMLPHEYDAGADLQMRFEVERTNAAEVSATIDLQAGLFNAAGDVSPDLYAGAAVDINAELITTVDFELTATGRSAGDTIDCRLAIAVDDTGGTGADFRIYQAFLLCDTRG